MNLATSLESIKGVGPKTAEQLEKAGLSTVGDMVMFLPRKHEDYSEITAIDDLTPGKHTIKITIDSTETRRVRRGMTVTTGTLQDSSGKVKAVWFNQPYRSTQFAPDTEYYVSGKFEFQNGRYQFTNPSVEKVSDMPVQTDRLLPVYRQVKGLKSQLVRKILHELRPLMTMLPDHLPPSIVKANNLVSFSDALIGYHFPETTDDIKKSNDRFGFEEVFQLLLASELNRKTNEQVQGYAIPFAQDNVKRFVEQLPFQLTNAQRRAAWSIIQDMEKTNPMNRMLQGDVGSGKTVVAGIAAMNAATAGYQTALMAPTEILARQHADGLQKLLQPLGIAVGLLVGSTKKSDRQLLYKSIAEGSTDIVIGTHALIQENVEYAKLGLVIIDEQHRFGVNQRQKLLEKSRKMPHFLAMTATPIPRSLQLTVFGELDISIIDEKPANRLPIITKIVSPISASKVYAAIDQEITRGRQAYVICGLITDTPNNQKKSVETEYKKLKNSVFGHRSIGLLHGRMKPDEKDQVMNDFAAKKYDILVSTTVVEVGVDVPNATAILIENADTFGLAQLHQLRGRVGRSDLQSYCYLMMSDNRRPTRRLQEIEKSNDGFYLAEVDLELRGPGEIYGRAQHGALDLQIARLSDTRLIARVQSAVKTFMLGGEDLLQYKQLAAQVERYQRLTTLN
ncbi:ATP-dependent DNA helicase RecG [Candidatus Saccharibacteria bacterium]|nr:ATP-dependent DNA helicase RecG [Candidatus Saccharibacteria bacterium]